MCSSSTPRKTFISCLIHQPHETWIQLWSMWGFLKRLSILSLFCLDLKWVSFINNLTNIKSCSFFSSVWFQYSVSTNDIPPSVYSHPVSPRIYFGNMLHISPNFMNHQLLFFPSQINSSGRVSCTSGFVLLYIWKLTYSIQYQFMS